MSGLPPPGPPPVQLLGGAVLLQGQAVLDVHALVRAGLRTLRRTDGIDAPVRVRRLDEALAAAAAAVAGARQVSRHAVDASQDWELPAELGSSEAADLLQLSQRTLQRRAAELGGRQIGGRWRFDTAALLAAHHAATRGNRWTNQQRSRS